MGYRWSIHGSICFISTEQFIIWQHSLSLQGEYFWATLELWACFNISVLNFFLFFMISNKIYWRENTKYTRCILGERIQIKLWKNRIQEVKQIRERIQFFCGHLVKQRAIKFATSTQEHSIHIPQKSAICAPAKDTTSNIAGASL